MRGAILTHFREALTANINWLKCTDALNSLTSFLLTVFIEPKENSNSMTSEQEPQSQSESAPNRYLSCIYCVWTVSRNRLENLCCHPDSNGSKLFLWGLFKQNARQTIAYYLLYFAFGMCVGFLGPTLEDLACYTKQPISSISWVFFAETLAMLFGILLSGLITRW